MNALLLPALYVLAQGSTAQLAPRAPVIAAFGACVVRQMPERARAVLATEMGSPQEQRAARSIALGNSACVRQNVLSMQSGEIRGTIATALLQADASAMAALAARPSRLPVRAAAAEGRGFVIGYSRCIADADPVRTAAVVATAYGSEQERAAILALGSALRDCMPHGVSYRLDRFDLRNHLAAHLFAVARAAPVGGGADA